MKVWIHADESCLGNGQKRATPGGAGVLLEVWEADGTVHRRDVWTSEPDTTNNRMAITSGIIALSALKKPCTVVFVSDSKYLVDGMTSWVHGWIRKGWQRKTGPVENVELWKQLVEAARPHKIEWRWVRGHDGAVKNEYVNDLAVLAANELTSGSGPSGFDAWLKDQQGRGRYLDFSDASPAAA